MAAFGAPVEIIETVESQKTDFEVFEDNWPAVEMFIRLQTQWQVIPGGWVGLNYQSLEFLLKIHKLANKAEIVESIQIMEAAALQILNERKE